MVGAKIDILMSCGFGGEVGIAGPEMCMNEGFKLVQLVENGIHDFIIICGLIGWFTQRWQCGRSVNGRLGWYCQGWFCKPI